MRLVAEAEATARLQEIAAARAQALAEETRLASEQLRIAKAAANAQAAALASLEVLRLTEESALRNERRRKRRPVVTVIAGTVAILVVGALATRSALLRAEGYERVRARAVEALAAAQARRHTLDGEVAALRAQVEASKRILSALEAKLVADQAEADRRRARTNQLEQRKRDRRHQADVAKREEERWRKGLLIDDAVVTRCSRQALTGCDQ